MLSVFEKVWSMSVTASVVIVFVLAARLLLKRAPKIISYALWAVVLIRLLCPVSLEAGFSLIPKPVAQLDAPEVSFDIPTAGQSPGYLLSVPEGFPVETLDISNATVYTMPADVIRPAQVVATETFRFPVEWVWFLGAAALVLVSSVRYGLLHRKLRFSLPVRENIYLADGIPSAFVVDILHPKIYLPSDLPPEEWDYVLAHERCHIRRGDPLIRLLSFAAVCLHWFNPLVWLAFYLAGQDMEMSCDEAVLRTLGENIRGDYSQTLLNLSAGRKLFAFTPLAFGEGDTGKRIRNLGKWKKPVVWVVVMAVVLCAILAVCLLTDPLHTEVVSDTANDGQLEVQYPQESAPEMVPTTSSMTGGYDGYLFIEINEQTYRFRRETIDPEGLTADRFLGIYYENTIYDFEDTVHYQVYSAKEYPDHTVLLVDVGGLYWASYRYAPAQRISDETWGQIRSHDGIVILEDGDVTSGQENFLAFARKAKEGKPCSIQTAAYYTLDPSRMVDELYQTLQEDYPCVYLHTLTYDGEQYTLSWVEDGQKIVRQYKYLMHYYGEAESANASYDAYDKYVLTNDDTVTWDDILAGMYSSQFGAYIDHYTVYNDYIR